MKSILIIICALLIGCKNSQIEDKIYYYDNGHIKAHEKYYNNLLEGEYVKYYDNDTISLKGNYTKDKREGVFYTYHKNGQVSSVVFYKNGKREGISYEFHPTAPLKFINTYFNDSIIRQELIDTIKNQVVALLENDRSTQYFENGKLQWIENGFHDRSKYYKIEFDNHGMLKHVQGKLKLINKDTFDLDRSYPNWEKQLKEWEVRNKK